MFHNWKYIIELILVYLLLNYASCRVKCLKILILKYYVIYAELIPVSGNWLSRERLNGLSSSGHR
jgi:hypothetical protein